MDGDISFVCKTGDILPAGNCGTADDFGTGRRDYNPAGGGYNDVFVLYTVCGVLYTQATTGKLSNFVVRFMFRYH